MTARDDFPCLHIAKGGLDAWREIDRLRAALAEKEAEAQFWREAWRQVDAERRFGPPAPDATDNDHPTNRSTT